MSRGTRNGYQKSVDKSPYGNKDGLDTRISVDNVSQTSQIPLDPIIKRTTSVHISYNEAHVGKEAKDSDDTLPQWNSDARRGSARPGV